MLTRVRNWLRDSRLWRDLRDLQRMGIGLALDRWRYGRKVLFTEPIRTSRIRGAGDLIADCEVHMLIWEKDLWMGLWAAKSFYRTAGVSWPMVWHQGGYLSRRSQALLLRHFPDSTVLLEDEIRPRVEGALEERGLRNCVNARRQAFMLRKLIDCLLVGNSRYLLVMDSDVLFFRRPDEILAAVAAGRPDALFNRDEATHYTIDPADAFARYGLTVPERLNAGLGLIRRAAWRLDLIDRFLSDGDVLRTPWLTEQTVQALLAAQCDFAFLPDTYMLSTRRGLTTRVGEAVIAKHYPSHPRPEFFREGVRKLLRDSGRATN